jgi:hypothetical protein
MPPILHFAAVIRAGSFPLSSACLPTMSHMNDAPNPDASTPDCPSCGSEDTEENENPTAEYDYWCRDCGEDSVLHVQRYHPFEPSEPSE